MACLALGFAGRPLQADSAVLTSVADTTLIEGAPDNNLGGAPIVNAVSILPARFLPARESRALTLSSRSLENPMNRRHLRRSACIES